jgi:hypothetical protein
MMSGDSRHEGNEPSGMMSVLMAPLLVVMVVGGAIALIDPPARRIGAIGTTSAPITPSEITGVQYEGLRDLLPTDPAMASRTLAALDADGVIDERDLATIVVGADLPMQPTSLGTAAARDDLTRTARAYAPKKG